MSKVTKEEFMELFKEGEVGLPTPVSFFEQFRTPEPIKTRPVVITLLKKPDGSVETYTAEDQPKH